MILPGLPRWRLIAGLAIYATLAIVLLDLAPVYVENYHLGRYIKHLASQPNGPQTTDDTLRRQIVAQAQQLKLPVAPGNVIIRHAGGKLQIEAKYNVQIVLFHIDLKMGAH